MIIILSNICLKIYYIASGNLLSTAAQKSSA